MRSQRSQPTIDLRCNTTIAYIGMHGVGEVDHGRTTREPQDFALGREEIDLVREKVDSNALEKLFGRSTLLHGDQIIEPFARLSLFVSGRAITALIFPMCGDT